MLRFFRNSGVGGSSGEYEESYNIVLLPEYVILPFPSVELPDKVMLAVDAILTAEGAEWREQVEVRIEEERVSAYAWNLQQIDNGVVIPPSGWKCAKCDKMENLWLNLTDGMILCGRKYWDGRGGNNHAVQHYYRTKYPLAVKLGTITADLEAADVFSYPEDETVIDPLLSQHLVHFGIDFSSLQKTELTTEERELDLHKNFDWNTILDGRDVLEPLYGPGYTGLANLGNSCLLASTMQVAFSTCAFSSRYYADISLRSAFDAAPADPTLDLNMQLTKLGHGLLSGRYSILSSEGFLKQEGIPPHMFRTAIAASNPESSTMRQQDALEFFLLLLEQVERVNSGTPKLDPSRSFKFGIEDRIQCPSGKVTYNRRFDYILSLDVPLHEATNKDDLEVLQKRKAQANVEGEKIAESEIVHPRVPLEACLASYSAQEEVADFFSTALKAKTIATKTTGLTSFPDYLVLHMRKYIIDDGWVPKKLDVYIDVPDIIDISHMRSKGFQPGEELLPDSAIDASLSYEFSNALTSADSSKGSNTEKATDWIFSNPNASCTSEIDKSGISTTATTIDAELPDGAGRYRLIGFVSHIGKTSYCGHYVAHVYKDGRWVLFNDEKVVSSVNPPKDMGYMYFFERLDG